MSITVVLQFVSVAVIVAIGICVAYFTFEMRKVVASLEENALLRKEPAGLHPELRFLELNDWVNTNYLSFLRRASQGWTSPADLITHIPARFEAEAEISADDYLLIGTRGYPEKVAVLLIENENEEFEDHPIEAFEIR